IASGPARAARAQTTAAPVAAWTAASAAERPRRDGGELAAGRPLPPRSDTSIGIGPAEDYSAHRGVGGRDGGTRPGGYCHRAPRARRGLQLQIVRTRGRLFLRHPFIPRAGVAFRDFSRWL